MSKTVIYCHVYGVNALVFIKLPYYTKNGKPAQVPMVAALISRSSLSGNKNLQSRSLVRGMGDTFPAQVVHNYEAHALLCGVIVKQLVRER